MPIYVEREKAVIKVYKEHVSKTLDTDIKNIKLWLETYNQFVNEASDPTIYVKVKEIKKTESQGKPKHNLIMEKVNVLTTVRDFVQKESISEDMHLEIIYKVYAVLNDIAKFNKKHMKGGNYWVNHDLHLDQFVITSDKKIMLLDPESFNFSETPLDYKYIFPIQEMIFSLTKIDKTKLLIQSKKSNSQI